MGLFDWFRSRPPLSEHAERVFPSCADPDNPLRVIRKSSFREYLNRIRPRLEALARSESEPEVIPEIVRAWKSADAG